MLEKVGYSVLASVLIRVILCSFKAAEALREEGNYSIKFRLNRIWVAFLSSARSRSFDDYWLPFWLGVAELLAYPVCMTRGKWEFIAYWLGVKTAISWKKWQGDSRAPYMRFLLGNALVLGFSYLGINFAAPNFFEIFTIAGLIKIIPQLDMTLFMGLAGILCNLSGTFVLSRNLLLKGVEQEALKNLIKDEKPFNRIYKYLAKKMFGLKNNSDLLDLFNPTSQNRMRLEKQSIYEPIKGLLWIIVGTLLQIIALVGLNQKLFILFCIVFIFCFIVYILLKFKK